MQDPFATHSHRRGGVPGTDLVPGRYLKDRFQLVDSYRVSLAAGLSCRAETGYTPGAGMGALTGDTTWHAAAVWMITQRSGSDGCPANMQRNRFGPRGQVHRRATCQLSAGRPGTGATTLIASLAPRPKKTQGDREIGQASLQTAQSHRDHVWQAQGPVACRNQMRPVLKGLLHGHRSRRNPHPLAMSPTQVIRIVKFFNKSEVVFHDLDLLK